MEPINVNFLFENTRWISTEVESIAGEIETSPISEKKYLDLSKRLDDTFRAIQNLETQQKTSTLFARTQAQSLKETCVELSQHLENAFVNREISLIQNDSVALHHGGATPEAIQKIEAQMNALLKNHALSIEQNKNLSEARRSIDLARIDMDGDGGTIRHMEWLATQRNVNWVEMNDLIPEEIEELFDIGKWVFDRNLKQAKTRFQKLPESHKSQFQEHMRLLAAKPFEDVTETIQALIATANNLAGNGCTYPSVDQIDELYLGLIQINDEENASGKIFSLDFNESAGG
ncbi:MAG: hypothetical protein V4492_01835 [Chlamydiota bacterium]